MSYKMIDGKLYEVKEVDATQLRIEVEQCLRVVNEQNGVITANENQIKTLEAQFDAQINNLQAQIKAIEERKVKACVPNQVNITNAKQKIEEIKSRLEEKKEAIKEMLPEAADKLGF